jgi:hypothetical protein
MRFILSADNFRDLIAGGTVVVPTLTGEQLEIVLERNISYGSMLKSIEAANRDWKPGDRVAGHSAA